jgi:hypothetical protein
MINPKSTTDAHPTFEHTEKFGKNEVENEIEMKEKKCGITFWESLWHWSAYTVDQYRVGLDKKKQLQMISVEVSGSGSDPVQLDL